VVAGEFASPSSSLQKKREEGSTNYQPISNKATR